MTIRRSGACLVAAVALALPAAGCAHDERTGGAAGAPAPTSSELVAAPEATAPGPQATATTSGVPAPPASASARPGAGAGRAVDPAPTTTGPIRLDDEQHVTDTPSCRPEVLLAATKAALTGQTVQDVAVFSCRNGYARLMAVAPPPAEIPDGQVFLHQDAKGWRVVARASAATDCGDTSLTAAVQTACAGLA
ncbi:hypothetical protein ABZU25_06205 [Micromonospora sp. NPDC005215]|uniref:hypothetical protein n=1 Tax=Micromonospora sp. NPDC005215 TaxID=3157024 RepID=UPI0033B5241D